MARFTPAACSPWAIAQAIERLLATPKTIAVRPFKSSNIRGISVEKERITASLTCARRILGSTGWEPFILRPLLTRGIQTSEIAKTFLGLLRCPFCHASCSGSSSGKTRFKLDAPCPLSAFDLGGARDPRTQLQNQRQGPARVSTPREPLLCRDGHRLVYPNRPAGAAECYCIDCGYHAKARG